MNKYRHYKNDQAYELLGEARHTETLEELVVYRALYDSPDYGANAIWARPKKMFFETVMHEGKVVPRFAQIDE